MGELHKQLKDLLDGAQNLLAQGVLPRLEDFRATLDDVFKDFGVIFDPDAESPKIPPKKTDDTWTQKDVVSRMARAVESGITGFPDLPKRIELTGFETIFGRLLTQTRQDGRERGRFVFSHRTEKTIVVGDTITGTNSKVVMSSEPPKKYSRFELAPIFHIHTHPNGLHEPLYHIEHFSDADLKSLVADPNIFGIVMISDGISLMALKTSASPRYVTDEQFDERAKALSKKARRDEHRSGDYPRILTKLLCLEYGLTLYLSRPNSRCIFNRAELTKK